MILKKESELEIFGGPIINLVDFFDKWSKLYFRLDAQTEIQILKFELTITRLLNLHMYSFFNFQKSIMYMISNFSSNLIHYYLVMFDGLEQSLLLFKKVNLFKNPIYASGCNLGFWDFE